MTVADVRTPALVAGLLLYSFWVLTHVGADPAYRTLFVEEFHTGEAGRAYHLFGTWVGEGGRWQSLPVTPFASLMSASAYGMLGEGLAALRWPFVAASLVGIALFALLCHREAPDDPWAVIVAVAVFCLSPFLTVLRPTSTNEVLYPLFTALLLLMLLSAEAGSDTRQRCVRYGLAGLLAGMILLVKVDGFAIPLALAIAVLIEMRAGRAKLAEFGAMALGGIVSGLLFAAAIFATLGLDRFLDVMAFAKEVLDHRDPEAPTIIGRLTAMLIALPKNLDVYFPGQSFLLIPSITLGIAFYSRLSLAARFCVVFMLTLIVWAAFAPLIYWKKTTIAAVPLVFLSLCVFKAIQNLEWDNISRRSLLLILVASCALAVAVSASTFKGMWKVVPFWSVATWNTPAVWLSLGWAGVWLVLARFVEMRRLYAGLYAATALVVVGLGLHQMVLWPPRHEVQKIGQAIAEALGDADVVADHNGYRFAAPFSKARFRFVHENDPAFPAAITEEAHKLRPRFVLVTNTYKPLEQQVDRELPEFRKTQSWTYVHPLASFNERPAKNVIVLYERAGEQDTLHNQHGQGAERQ